MARKRSAAKKRVVKKTIKFSKLRQLAFCNSKRLPGTVVINNVVKEWVGIGWIDLDRKPTPKDTVVIDD